LDEMVKGPVGTFLCGITGVRAIKTCQQDGDGGNRPQGLAKETCRKGTPKKTPQTFRTGAKKTVSFRVE